MMGSNNSKVNILVIIFDLLDMLYCMQLSGRLISPNSQSGVLKKWSRDHFLPLNSCALLSCAVRKSIENYSKSLRKMCYEIQVCHKCERKYQTW